MSLLHLTNEDGISSFIFLRAMLNVLYRSKVLVLPLLIDTLTSLTGTAIESSDRLWYTPGANIRLASTLSNLSRGCLLIFWLGVRGALQPNKRLLLGC